MSALRTRIAPDHTDVPQNTEEEFGLVDGPLGHLMDRAVEEQFYTAAAWEDRESQGTREALEHSALTFNF